MRILLSITILSLIIGCSNGSPKTDFGAIPFKNENGNLTAVIEIPAGTNKKFEYNYEKKDFECEIRNGKPRTVKYLPYVGNYGFISGTYMNPSIGGDGDALDVLVIGQSIPQGSIIEIEPIATLRLLDSGEEDHKIIAVPKNQSESIIKGTSFKEIPAGIKEIVKTWFLNYKGPGEMIFDGWMGKDSTIIEIKKWKK